MDEIADDGSAKLSDPEEADPEKRGLIPEEVFDASDTRNARNSEILFYFIIFLFYATF